MYSTYFEYVSIHFELEVATRYDFLSTCNKFLWCMLDKFVMSVKYQIFIRTMHLYHCHGGSNSVDSKFIAFLAWQTWEVLYNMFKLLCRNFTTQNPVYYVSPLHFNGSAVEMLFSQLKFISNRDLCATRYPQALNFDHQRKCTQRESCR